MKKVIGLLVLMMVFCFGFGAGQYFYEKGLTIPGLAMASAKPVVNMRILDWSDRSDGTYQWGIFITTDRPIVHVEQKTSTQAAIWTK